MRNLLLKTQDDIMRGYVQTVPLHHLTLTHITVNLGNINNFTGITISFVREEVCHEFGQGPIVTCHNGGEFRPDIVQYEEITWKNKVNTPVNGKFI